MNALEQNRYTEAWRRIADSMPRPKAILMISAHWYIPGIAVTAMERPETIHDFGGFPQALFEMQYPAPGDPDLARRVAEMLQPIPVILDQQWGLDHGTWSVLAHAYPNADVPVVQLSLDRTKPFEFHYELGRRLAALRKEGVLIAASGNVVHNLRHFILGAQTGIVDAVDNPAARFENEVKQRIVTNDMENLIHYNTLGPDAHFSVPTPEHYLPLLYVLGARQPDEAILFPIDGIQGGAISMLCVQVGESPNQ